MVEHYLGRLSKYINLKSWGNENEKGEITHGNGVLNSTYDFNRCMLSSESGQPQLLEAAIHNPNLYA